MLMKITLVFPEEAGKTLLSNFSYLMIINVRIHGIINTNANPQFLEK